MTTANDEIRPFRAQTPQESLDDLRGRLNRVRWASEVPGPSPEGYGVSLAWVRRLTEYWRDSYDWRAAEAKLDSYPQFVTEIDGQDIHFLGKSPDPGALPLILMHGWPGSVVEFLNVIGPLTDLPACGKDPAAAFALVVPSLIATTVTSSSVDQLPSAYEPVFRRAARSLPESHRGERANSE